MDLNNSDIQHEVKVKKEPVDEDEETSLDHNLSHLTNGWFEYQCNSGEVLFYFNIFSNEHRWMGNKCTCSKEKLEELSSQSIGIQCDIDSKPKDIPSQDVSTEMDFSLLGDQESSIAVSVQTEVSCVPQKSFRDDVFSKDESILPLEFVLPGRDSSTHENNGHFKPLFANVHDSEQITRAQNSNLESDPMNEDHCRGNKEEIDEDRAEITEGPSLTFGCGDIQIEQSDHTIELIDEVKSNVLSTQLNDGKNFKKHHSPNKNLLDGESSPEENSCDLSYETANEYGENASDIVDEMSGLNDISSQEQNLKDRDQSSISAERKFLSGSESNCEEKAVSTLADICHNVIEKQSPGVISHADCNPSTDEVCEKETENDICPSHADTSRGENLDTFSLGSFDGELLSDSCSDNTTKSSEEPKGAQHQESDQSATSISFKKVKPQTARKCADSLRKCLMVQKTAPQSSNTGNSSTSTKWYLRKRTFRKRTCNDPFPKRLKILLTPLEHDLPRVGMQLKSTFNKEDNGLLHSDYEVRESDVHSRQESNENTRRDAIPNSQEISIGDQHVPGSKPSLATGEIARNICVYVTESNQVVMDFVNSSSEITVNSEECSVGYPRTTKELKDVSEYVEPSDTNILPKETDLNANCDQRIKSLPEKRRTCRRRKGKINFFTRKYWKRNKYLRKTPVQGTVDSGPVVDTPFTDGSGVMDEDRQTNDDEVSENHHALSNRDNPEYSSGELPMDKNHEILKGNEFVFIQNKIRNDLNKFESQDNLINQENFPKDLLMVDGDCDKDEFRENDDEFEPKDRPTNQDDHRQEDMDDKELHDKEKKGPDANDENDTQGKVGEKIQNFDENQNECKDRNIDKKGAETQNKSMETNQHLEDHLQDFSTMEDNEDVYTVENDTQSKGKEKTEKLEEKREQSPILDKEHQVGNGIEAQRENGVKIDEDESENMTDEHQEKNECGYQKHGDRVAGSILEDGNGGIPEYEIDGSDEIRAEYKPPKQDKSPESEEKLPDVEASGQITKETDSIGQGCQSDNPISFNSDSKLTPTTDKDAGESTRGSEGYPNPTRQRQRRAILSCKFCDRRFKSSFKLSCHMRGHKLTKIKTCNICLRTFRSCSHLCEHMKYHNTSSNYSCSYCNEGFISYQKLVSHFIKCSETKSPSKKTNCGSDAARDEVPSTASPPLKNGPQLDAVTPSKLKCNICNVVYVYPKSLRKHLELHSRSSNGPAAKNALRESYKVLDDYTAHGNCKQRSLPGDVTITAVSNDEVPESPNITSSIDIEKNDKPSLSCSICGMDFVKAYWFDRHMQYKHGISPGENSAGSEDAASPSEDADEDYDEAKQDESTDMGESRQQLENVVRIVSGEGPLKCYSCGIIFKKEFWYKKHVKHKHGISVEFVPPSCPPQTPEPKNDKRNEKEKASKSTKESRKNLPQIQERTENVTEKGKKERKMYKCKVCDREFVHLGHLENHSKHHDLVNKSNTKEIGTSPRKAVPERLPLEVAKFAGKDRNSSLNADVCSNDDNVVIGYKRNNFKCSECREEFPHLDDLLKHSNETHAPHKCPHCEMRCSNSEELQSHLQIHRKDASTNAVKTISCKICGKEVSTAVELITHFRTHKRGRKRKVGETQEKEEESPPTEEQKSFEPTGSNSFDVLNSQTGKEVSTVQDPKETLSGSVVPKSPKSPDPIRNTKKQKNLGFSVFFCYLCNKAFNNIGKRLLHMKRSHPDGNRYACSICGQGFQESHSYNLHKREQHNIKSADSPRSPDSNRNNVSSIQTVPIITSDQHFRYRCSICGRAFRREHFYNLHKLKHHNVKSTESQTDYFETSSVHNNNSENTERAENDDEPCIPKKRIFSKSNTTGDSESHRSTGRSISSNADVVGTKPQEKPVGLKRKHFKCSICSRVFLNKKNLRRHEHEHEHEHDDMQSTEIPCISKGSSTCQPTDKLSSNDINTSAALENTSLATRDSVTTISKNDQSQNSPGRLKENPRQEKIQEIPYTETSSKGKNVSESASRKASLANKSQNDSTATLCEDQNVAATESANVCSRDTSNIKNSMPNESQDDILEEVGDHRHGFVTESSSFCNSETPSRVSPTNEIQNNTIETVNEDKNDITPESTIVSKSDLSNKMNLTKERQNNTRLPSRSIFQYLNLETHSCASLAGEKYKCSYCTLSFTSFYQRNSHVNTTHKTKLKEGQQQ